MLKHSRRNQFALACSVLSLGMLVPGLMLSMLSITTTGAVDTPVSTFDINLFDTSNSILTTVSDLFEQGYYFVSVMIFTFSVIIPTAKIVMLIQMMIIADTKVRGSILKVVQNIGKWSMSDVFIVSVFLAYLSTGSGSRAESHQASVLGIPFDIDVLVNMDAHLNLGFYCFLSYCIFSLAASQLFTSEVSQPAKQNQT